MPDITGNGGHVDMIVMVLFTSLILMATQIIAYYLMHKIRISMLKYLNEKGYILTSRHAITGIRAQMKRRGMHSYYVTKNFSDPLWGSILNLSWYSVAVLITPICLFITVRVYPGYFENFRSVHVIYKLIIMFAVVLIPYILALKFSALRDQFIIKNMGTNTHINPNMLDSIEAYIGEHSGAEKTLNGYEQP